MTFCQTVYYILCVMFSTSERSFISTTLFYIYWVLFPFADRLFLHRHLKYYLIGYYCIIIYFMCQRCRVGLRLSTRLVSSQWWILSYMFSGLIHWWVEVLHADRATSMCIHEQQQNLKWGCCSVKPVKAPTPSPPPAVIYYWPFQSDVSVVVYSNCQCSAALRLCLTYCLIYLG